MNLLHLKYALEVASSGSINKAAEKLEIEQPNLSRSIKELETALGVSIFSRSSRGMKVTVEGEEFLKYAEKILKQVDYVENMFRKDYAEKKKFSISVPRASYICDAFSSFAESLPHEEGFEIIYRETNALRAIKNIMEADYNLGIIRYAEQYDKYYKDMMENKGLAYEFITDFHYTLLMNEKSPLADLDEIHFSDLMDKTEIAHADPYVPYLPLSEVKKEELPVMEKRIFVFERASQFELLAKNTDMFMWVSPVPVSTLKRYGLIERVCEENRKTYKDVMIYKKDYRLTELDKSFITELCRVKRGLFGIKTFS
ncbi:MAG: LysR family transcriptional regulator [Treponema sp.]|nr:LysR family transcriptional regulator [Candidatus Treponema caballi]